MKQAALALALLVAGCSAPTSDLDDTVVRFAVIAAPELTLEQAEGELSSEDALHEVVTQLSIEAKLDFCLVPGPLLSSEDEDLRFGLIGALGQLAGQLIVALGPNDGPQIELLEAFEEMLPGHPGELAYRGDRVGPLRPIALDPEGGTPKKKKKKKDQGKDDPEDQGNDEAAKEDRGGRLFVQGGAAASKPALLVVRAGPALRFEEVPEGGVVLEIPSVARPPHVYAVAELRGGTLTVELRSVEKTNLVNPAPIRLIRVPPQ